jgi:hypothetical protein
MADQAGGLRERRLVPDLSGVPPSVRTLDLQRASLEPPHEQTGFQQAFSGVDYRITAVMPYHDRLSTSPAQGEGEILEALGLLENRILGDPTMDPVQLADLKQQKTVLLGALDATRSSGGKKGLQPFYKTFGEIQTLTITSRRSVEPVRRLGESSPAEYLGGPRTFAGTMIFTLLQEEPLLDLYRSTDRDRYDGEPYLVMDRLPPFNILITGSNEFGHLVESALFGVTLVADGTTLSIDDLFTEQQYTYVARSKLPFTKRARNNSLLAMVGRPTLPVGLGAISELNPSFVVGSVARTGNTLGRGFPVRRSR